jgi:hypothetical protein
MKTAVEWLAERCGLEALEDVIAEAKEMEKEHLCNFVDFINERHFNSFRISKDEVEIYYNETFKQEQ